MFKQITLGEIRKGERTYQLFCDSLSPLGELHDVLMEMKGHCVEKMIEAQKQEAEIAEQQKKLDEADKI